MRDFIEKRLFLGSMTELIKIIVNNTLAKEKKAYYAINSDCMLKYWEDVEYKKIINENDNVVYVDGMGVVLAQKILNLPVAKERISTTDLFPQLMDHLNNSKDDIRIFLLGGKGETAEVVKRNFNQKYPNVNIVGTYHGYFDKDNNSIEIIEIINSMNVNILFVGFGNPVQEKWVKNHYDLIDVNSIITCGGLFDYYSNNVKRAPKFMQKAGFEWLYRLLQEPSRLYQRYIFGNIKYLFKVFNFKVTKLLSSNNAKN